MFLQISCLFFLSLNLTYSNALKSPRARFKGRSKRLNNPLLDEIHENEAPGWFTFYGSKICEHPYTVFLSLKHKIECKNTHFGEGTDCRLKVSFIHH